MENLSPLDSLAFFEETLPAFLSPCKDKVLEVTGAIKEILKEPDTSNFHASLLEKGKILICHILTAGINYLSDYSNSPKNHAIRFMEKFLDDFVAFEELLFGLNPNYRDHTLHSLWVYLFGHRFIMGLGGYSKIKISGQAAITYFRQSDKTPLFFLAPEVMTAPNEHMESMWALIALLHDIGYPVETISNRANEIFGKVLDPFAIDFSNLFQIDMSSRIATLHENICKLVSSVYRPEAITEQERKELMETVKERETKNEGIPFVVLRKPIIRQDQSLEMEYKIAWVNKNHSAWSSTFAFKNIPCLHESDYHAGGNIDYLGLLTRRDIVYSILHHTVQEPRRDIAVNRFCFLLLFVDDIEDSTRYGKGGRTRGIMSDLCKIKWEISSSKLRMEFDYSEHEEEVERKRSGMTDRYIEQRTMNGDYEITLEFKTSKSKESLILRMTNDLQAP